MANNQFKIEDFIKEVQEVVDDSIEGYLGTHDKNLAVASTLLSTVIGLYRLSLGNEKTVEMIYSVADGLALDLPPKVKFPKKK